MKLDRASTSVRLAAKDHGIVLKHGDGPDGCDIYGAREAQVFSDGQRYYLHYDGAAEDGWAACLAVSENLTDWKKLGRVLPLGEAGSPDSAAACSPWVYYEGGLWHMFYLGAANASPAPDRVPIAPYLTLKAYSESPTGPWHKQYDVVPFGIKEGTYYSETASPGHIIKHQDEYLQFFSAGTPVGEGKGQRTISIARTKDLNDSWEIDSKPMLPLFEQLENTSLYYEKTNGFWFVFTNHISRAENGEEYASEAWVYWSQDPLKWDPQNKAIVVDRTSSSWSPRVIGMPSVIPFGERLAVFYDGSTEDTLWHMKRDIGLAWLDLPLQPPK